MAIYGYSIINKNGKVVRELVGHYKRTVLNKFRFQGYKVKKINRPLVVADSRGEEMATVNSPAS